MKKTILVAAILLLISGGVAVASSFTTPCPKVIGVKNLKTYATAATKYVCFKSYANAKAAGYRDENSKRKWYPLTTFSGTVDQTTDSFSTTASQWKMTWTHPGDDNFSIVVYDAVTNSYKKLVVNTIGATNASSNYYGSGRFYLDIGAGSDWTVSIQEYR